MSKGGRQGKYHEWLTDDGLLRIESWASDGYTNTDIAHNMGIAYTTLKVWLNKYPTINAALKKGREPVVRKLENTLINKALGFEYEETETYFEDVEGQQKKRVKRFKKQSLPDTSALIFLLKNYKPQKYRNYNDLTKKQINADIDKTIAETAKINSEIQSGETLEDKLDDFFDMLGGTIDEYSPED